MEVLFLYIQESKNYLISNSKTIKIGKEGNHMAGINRVIWIILDSVGMGALPDADRFGDEGTNTIAHVSAKHGGLKVPNMVRLGLGNIDGMLGIEK